jgi:hypothetical protein
MVYENWNEPNEPNNSGGQEHCVTAGSTGNWNDLSCTDERSIICEEYDGDVNPWPTG